MLNPQGCAMTEKSLAPVVLFVYNRAEHTLKTIAALKANDLALQTDLFVYADGARSPAHQPSVDAVRECIADIKGFKSVTVNVSQSNRGLTDSIVGGVTTVVQQYGQVIVVEDDIVVSPTFLDYMNDALTYYKNNDRVWHIAGWGYPTQFNTEKDVFFYRLMQCWGWATWSDKWAHLEMDSQALHERFDNKRRKRFNIDGYDRIWNQIKHNRNNKINTWDVFWYATIFERDGLCLCPTKSFVRNIGHGDGVHCKDTSFVDNDELNTKSYLTFEDHMLEDADILQQIKTYLWSQKKGLFAKVKTYLRTR